MEHATIGYWAGDIAMTQLEEKPHWKRFVEDADVIFPISPSAAATAHAVTRGRVVPASTGVSIDRFTDAAPAKDLDAIPRPIAGYAGGLASERFDLALYLATAVALPDVSFVAVGPADDTIRTALKNGPSNVHYLGTRSYDDVPSYVAAFDVGL